MVEFYILSIVALLFTFYGFFGSLKQSKQAKVQLGLFRISAGLSMSFIGGAATIAMAGIGYSNGLIGFVDPLAVLFGGIIVILLLVFFSVPSQDEGIASFLAGGCSKRSIVYALCSLFVYILLASAQIVALEKIFTPYIDSDIARFVSLVVFALVCGYIFLRGIAAVTQTDVLQFFIVLFLFLLPAIFGIYELQSSNNPQISIEQEELSLRTILLLSLSLIFVPVSQDVWVRVRRAKSLKVAKYGILFGVLIYFSIVGTAIYLGHISAKNGIAVNDSESILPYFFTSQLGLAGIVSALVLLAAVISTLDSFTYNLTANLSEDILPRINKKISNKLKRTISVVVVFIACTFIAFKANSILALVLTALMLYVSVIMPGFLLRNYVKDEVSLWMPALITLISIIIMTILQYQAPYEPYSILVAHVVLILLVNQFRKLRLTFGET